MYTLALFFKQKFRSFKAFHKKFNDIGLSSENILANLKLLQEDELSEDNIFWLIKKESSMPIRPKKTKEDIVFRISTLTRISTNGYS